MFEFGGFFCSDLKRSVASMLPWDIPWYDPSHTVFFAALYGALTVIGIGVISAAILAIRHLKSGHGEAHH